MKIILALIVKDLKRDWKHPWSIVLFSALPLLMTGLIAAVFGGHSGAASMPTVHVAVLDLDNDLLSRFLRSLSGQGESSKQLRLHFVESRQEGVRLLVDRKASAFIALPRNMTGDLLKGRTNVIELYENPSEQVLPKVVRQGTYLLASGLSGAGELLGEPLTEIRTMVEAETFPDESAVAGVAARSVKKLGHMKSYLFPPLIRFQTVEATNYVIAPTNTVASP